MKASPQSVVSQDGRFRLRADAEAFLQPVELRVGQRSFRRGQIRGLRGLSRAYTILPQTYFLKPAQIELVAPRTSDAGVYRLGSRRAYPIRDARFRDGRWTFSIREGGAFAVLRDTVAPKLKPPRKRIFVRSDKKVRPFRLYFRAEDSGSGTDFSNMEIEVDGKPALGEHDRDLRLVEIFSPETIYRKGRHQVQVRARDLVGHRSSRLRFSYIVR